MWSSSLRDEVFALHESHDVGGDALACLECVVAVLNNYEREYLRNIEKRYRDVE